MDQPTPMIHGSTYPDFSINHATIDHFFAIFSHYRWQFLPLRMR
jgi:hypothetical protein